jgi:hypothetical protein
VNESVDNSRAELTDGIPARVVMVDVEEGPPEISSIEPRYRSAWFLFRSDRRPRALVEVALEPPGAAQTLVERAMAEVIGQSPGPILPMHGDEPTVSVVIPTVVGRVEPLAACLNALAKSEYDRYEVVLVDNRRTIPTDDPLPDLVANRTGVRVVRQVRPGISAARNAGVAASDSDVIAFTDDDVQVDAGWVRAIAQRFATHPDEQVVTGLVLPSELDTPAQMMFERYYGGFASERTFAPLSFGIPDPGGQPWSRAVVVARDDDGHETRRFAIYGAGACGAGCNMAFRRSALAGPEPFDVALGTGTPAQGGEDLAAMIRVLWEGGRIGYEPAAIVHHQHRRGYDELRRQMWGYGAGFTAMLTSLVMRDPSHLVGVASQAPRAAARMAVGIGSKLRGRRPQGADKTASQPSARSFPAELARREVMGYAQGMAKYLRSRREARAWTG